MTGTSCPRKFGLGRAKPGFNGVYVICAEAAANIPENQRKEACSKLTKGARYEDRGD